MTMLAVAPILDWENLSGQSKLVVDLVTIPLFSAFAGLLTNWTGVLMLFAPAQFTGFYVPGLRRVFPFLPRKVQILPIFAPNGILGFQGFIPCRAEKMSSLVVDKTIARIGRIEDFYTQLEPERLAARLADAARPEIRRLTIEIIERDHATLWRTLPNIAREKVLRTVDAELTTISRHAFATIGDNIDELLDVKLMTVNYLRRHPELLRDIIKGMAVPELKFMVRSGALGLPLGVVLAQVLSFAHYAHLPLPGWLIVVAGAALIGVVVNVIAIKVVFEPGEPRPRYRYLWRQGLFARRQHEAAAQLAAMLATKVLTVANFSHELFHGAHGERTLALIASSVSAEVDRVLGPFRIVARNSLGIIDVDALGHGTGVAVREFAPTLLSDDDFTREEAHKIDTYATEKLRSLPADEFGEMLYAAVEQDAWLLYVHGAVLGILVGAVHILIFGA